jgi:hypothetical protein
MPEAPTPTETVKPSVLPLHENERNSEALRPSSQVSS